MKLFFSSERIPHSSSSAGGGAAREVSRENRKPNPDQIFRQTSNMITHRLTHRSSHLIPPSKQLLLSIAHEVESSELFNSDLSQCSTLRMKSKQLSTMP